MERLSLAGKSSSPGKCRDFSREPVVRLTVCFKLRSEKNFLLAMPHSISLITTIAAGLGMALVMGF
ncbi:MAG TPA: hypothetical protein VL968_09105, partial [Rhodocyclaceae bacterium]|nr:hypothetical protein [Rhodocyclaceae bacterium]